MTNQFFYDNITSKFEEYKGIVRGVMFKHKKILFNALPEHIKKEYENRLIPQELLISIQKPIISEYEKAVINELKEFFTKQEIHDFALKFPAFLEQREILLESYVHGRLRQEQQIHGGKIKKYLKLNLQNNLLNQNFSVIIDTLSYIRDSALIHELELDPGLFIKNINPEEYKHVKLLHSQNIAVITTKSNGEKFKILSRSKRNKRELEKLVDSLTGIRPEWAFDSIATLEIFPEHDFYKGIERIREFNKQNHNEKLKIDYRGIKSSYDSEDFKEIIREGNKIQNKISKNQKVTPEDNKALLRGAWIDHYPKDVALETIVMIPKFYEWYTGPIGHDAVFLQQRAEKRRENLKQRFCTQITAYLQKTFNELYKNDILN